MGRNQHFFMSQEKTEYARYWRDKNREHYRAYQNAYQKRSRAKYRAYYRDYARAHREEISARRELYPINPDVTAAYYLKNRDKLLAIAKERYKMNRAKIKGRNAENAVIKLLSEYGIQAERVPLSGSLGGEYKHDIAIPSIKDRKLSIEVKHRESISKCLWDWKSGVDILVLKKNYHPMLAIVSWDVLTDLIKERLNENTNSN